MRNLLLGQRHRAACQHNNQLLIEYLQALDANYAAHRPYIEAYLADNYTGLHQLAAVLEEAGEELCEAREKLQEHQSRHRCSAE